MNRKYISLSLLLPYYLLAQTPTVTALDEVKVETQSERKTSSLNIDLEKYFRQKKDLTATTF